MFGEWVLTASAALFGGRSEYNRRCRVLQTDTLPGFPIETAKRDYPVEWPARTPRQMFRNPTYPFERFGVAELETRGVEDGQGARAWRLSGLRSQHHPLLGSSQARVRTAQARSDGGALDRKCPRGTRRITHLYPQIVVESAQLPQPFHRDPADQLLVATARIFDCPLMTEHSKIVSYPHVRLT